MLTSIYAAAARRRREWYAGHPEARKRLRRPVISVGNIAAGGRGKTPFAAFVARLLLELGERPSILSRGYGRTDRVEGAVIVRDADDIRASLGVSGDEPLMLARQLPGTVIVTSPDRYVGGCVAEHHLGATVHVLDDGFQHFALDRDVDIVLVANSDLTAATFPAGRLREPPDVLIAADAIVGVDPCAAPHDFIPFFLATRTVSPPVFEGQASSSGPIFAVAGIANPDSFFATLSELEWPVVGNRAFRDHHPYSARDVAEVTSAARAAGADAIVTTEKDWVRLAPHRPFALPVGFVPLTMGVEPPEPFRQWLATSLAAARDIVAD